MEKSPAVVNVPWLDLHPWYKQEVFLLCFESYAELHHMFRKALISEPSLLSPHTHHVVTSRSRNRTSLLPQKPPPGDLPVTPPEGDHGAYFNLTDQFACFRLSIKGIVWVPLLVPGFFYTTLYLEVHPAIWVVAGLITGAFAGHKGCTCAAEWVGRGAGLGVRGSDFLSGLCHSSAL